MDRHAVKPDPGPETDGPNVLVVGDEALAGELVIALRKHRVTVSETRTAEGVHAVVHDAPDLIVLVGSARRGGAGQLLQPLTDHPACAVVPVVLLSDTAEIPNLSAPANSFTQGVVGRVQSDLGAETIADEVLRILDDLPGRPSEARGIVAEATLDELVDILSRELQSGVLSVQGAREARIVLRAGKPVSGSLDGFVEQVRPMLERSGAEYAFVSHPAARVDSVPPPEAASREVRLQDTRVLVFHHKRKVAAAWAAALRELGAETLCLDNRRDVPRARAFDPQVLLLEPEALDGGKRAVLEMVQRDARLRWAATLVAPDAALAHPERPVFYMTAVAERIDKLTEAHRELGRLAASGEPFETRLELVGPAQLLRILSDSRRALTVKVRHTHAHVDLVLSGGRILEARGLRRDRGTEPVEAEAALALVCALRNGRVSVQPSQGFVRQRAAEALSLDPADLRLPSPLPSSAPAPLVSSIPPPPRVPTGAGGRRAPARVPPLPARPQPTPRGDGFALAALALAVAAVVVYAICM